MADGPARRAPRFVFLCDGRGEDSGARRFGWRLVAANNRPLGRGMHAHASLAACRAAASRVRGAVAAVQAPVTLDASRGHWSWQLRFDGVAAAACVHTYLRRAECLRALEQFYLAVVAADPADGVVRYFGPHSLRQFEDLPSPEIEPSRTPS
jgi:hypothetical protein